MHSTRRRSPDPVPDLEALRYSAAARQELSLELPRGVYERLEAVAERTHQSLSDVLELALDYSFQHTTKPRRR